MNVLFVHQNFPGQFIHLARRLSREGHRVEALGIGGAGLAGVEMHRYAVRRESDQQAHEWARDFEVKIIRGKACAEAAGRLKAGGFTPDVIIANPSWGESLFLKDVWPHARLLALIELHYAPRGLDVDFDPEFYRPSMALDARLRAKNAYRLMILDGMDWGICPTQFQRSTIPSAYQDRVSVIFEGVNTEVAKPDGKATLTVNGRTLRPGDEVVTFVNRNLEPYRGYHVFMRSLPEILRQRPNAVVLIVGGDKVSYGPPAPAGKTWKQIFLDEVKGDLDLDRVIFMGKIPHAEYMKVLQVSACHVYLTYPFVLSWSCVEALSTGCLVIGSATPPVKEVITDGENGVLVDFFDTAGLTRAVVDALARPQLYAQLRVAAREGALERYDLISKCLPRQVELVEKLAAGELR